MRRLNLSLALIALAGCSNHARKNENIRAQDRATIQTELAGEMSLKSDRDQLSELRKDIPVETQKTNDELALFLSLMNQGKEQPATVRERFNALVHKRRRSFNEKLEWLRKDYRKEETRRREDFTRRLQKDRDEFMGKRRAGRETQRFSSDQERERARFNADERDRRANFETEMRAQSKDFESYMREKMNEFNEQYRLYSKQYSEKPKEKKAVTGDDFKRLDEMPLKELGTDD